MMTDEKVPGPPNFKVGPAQLTETHETPRAAAGISRGMA